MLRIGYLRLAEPAGEAEGVSEDPAAILRNMGCNAVRAEEDEEGGQVLLSILDFIGQDDELVTPDLAHLGRSGRGILELIERLEERGAVLVTAHPPMRSDGPAGATLKTVLRAVAALEPPETRRRTRAPAHEIRALQRAGMGPVAIAKRLGVSRMTVWRKLKAMEGEACPC